MDQTYFALSPTPERGVRSQRDEPPPPQTPLLFRMPADVLNLVAERVGSDLGRFAAVCQTTAELAANNSAWKRAAQHRHTVEDTEMADAMPMSLWKPCLLHDAGSGASQRE